MEEMATSWPFVCTKEQMDALTAMAAKIEDFMGEVEETIHAAGLPTDGMPDWESYTQGVYQLQSLLRYWGDYSGYVRMTTGEEETSA